MPARVWPDDDGPRTRRSHCSAAPIDDRSPNCMAPIDDRHRR